MRFLSTWSIMQIIVYIHEIDFVIRTSANSAHNAEQARSHFVFAIPLARMTGGTVFHEQFLTVFYVAHFNKPPIAITPINDR